MTLTASPTTEILRPMAGPVEPATTTRHGVGVADVSLCPSGFWGSRQTVNATATLRHCLEWMERLGWIENFDRVASGETTVTRPGWQFSDSEIYKLLEAMAWELGRSPDPSLAAAFEALVERIGAAQDDDGYLNTAHGHPGLPSRYSDMAMGHELYNTGHLLQAAVARLRTGHDDGLVHIARRAADQVCAEFGAHGRDAVCGHPEIEVALVEAGRAFSEPRYFEQARVFIERRGHGTLPVRPLLSAEYFQDDIPVRKANALRGHAVRALYLAAGALDVATETDDQELTDAVTRQWENTVARRTYLTGGMGSRHQDEGFGDDWELPADRAYCETCAGVGSVMLAWRLYLVTGDSRYPDLIERTLFNVVATSPSEDGRSFFYANPLHQREPGAVASDGVNTRAEGGVRAPWFDVSCCPTNVARTISSLGSYVASVDDRGISVLQYAAGEIRAGGFVLQVETQYPDEGTVRVRVLAAPASESRLRLRIPGWAATATLAVNGDDAVSVAPGWADIRRTFERNDEVILELPLAPRLTWPDSRIDAVRDTVAVERGPLVLCVESTDLPTDVRIEELRLQPDLGLSAHADGAHAHGTIAVQTPAAGPLPFGPTKPHFSDPKRVEITFVPYHRWAERGPAAMRIFLPVAG
ncbi:MULTISPECIES: glycoside hydrolase family 127 protein [Cryobacterium]|uniref:glycoside hydrolase family 127 protein n=1 Tax=Cryobacterium TaxID=69578 RepID=UPI001F546489|nr:MULTISPECIES: beta-L-arabinofuranosidase domain-containing protein [Cryobacterium]